MNRILYHLRWSAFFLLLLAAQACSPSHTIGGYARQELLSQPGLTSAQVGISLYDPATAQWLYDHQGDKYFIPASNTKLFSLYAGLKYLGDSVPGILYKETDTALFIAPCGDPSFLHPAYVQQPVFDLLKTTHKNIYIVDTVWKEEALGAGWAWDDYNGDYLSERSSFPVYGNLIRWIEEGKTKAGQDDAFDPSPSFYSIPDVDWPVRFSTDSSKHSFYVQRDWRQNAFEITEGKEKHKEQDVPFITDGIQSALLLLKDTLGKTISVAPARQLPAGLRVLHSRPVDSVFTPMMHQSDNFFAEQTLLMVSQHLLKVMNDSRVIDTLLNSDLKGIPQRPYWVDGSGLSRNDLFTPHDFIWLLDKMQKEYSLSRLEKILPTGGTGTLSKYYKQDSGYIFAKTGSLSGVVALSGYVFTKKRRLLLFSILVNNNSDPAVRRKMEKFIHRIRDKY